MNVRKKLPRASVVRMELYIEVLEQWIREGRSNITSGEIGNALGIAPVKIRQDMFRLGTSGKPKVGYDASQLLHLIRDAFDLDSAKPACLVGFGNLGRAIAGSNIWLKGGFDLVVAFDSDPNIVGSEFGDRRVRSISEFYGVVKSEGVQAGVIAVPVDAAQDIADMMVDAGIKAIWNFAPTKLSTPDNVVVENQSLVWGLITLSFRLKTEVSEVDADSN